MSTTTDTQRIYVASLSDYNAGRLHGTWIDLADVDDTDDVYAKVKTMLAASPEFKAFPQGGPAEEWAIHDYEGFGGYRISEYESFDTVVLLAKLIEAKGDAFSTWLENDPSVIEGGDFYDIESAFDESYAGEWDSEKQFAENYVDECGWAGLEGETLEKISSYLDYDSIARDLFMDGYWFSNGYVFRST